MTKKRRIDIVLTDENEIPKVLHIEIPITSTYVLEIPSAPKAWRWRVWEELEDGSEKNTDGNDCGDDTNDTRYGFPPPLKKKKGAFLVLFEKIVSFFRNPWRHNRD